MADTKSPAPAAAVTATPSTGAAAATGGGSSFVGSVTWIAGNLDRGFADGKASRAEFHFPYGVTKVKLPKKSAAAATAGGGGGAAPTEEEDVLLIADGNNNRIRAVHIKDNLVSTFAGTGKEGNTNGPATTEATFKCPNAVSIDTSAPADQPSVLVSESRGHCIRRITLPTLKAAGGAVTATVSHVAGQLGIKGYGDGSVSQAQFSAPCGILTQSSTGKIFVADSGNNRIRVILPSKEPADPSKRSVATVVGNGIAMNVDGKVSTSLTGLGGGGGVAALWTPRYLCWETKLTADNPEPERSFYISCTHAIRRFDTVTGQLTTVPLSKALDPYVSLFFFFILLNLIALCYPVL